MLLTGFNWWGCLTLCVCLGWIYWSEVVLVQMMLWAFMSLPLSLPPHRAPPRFSRRLSLSFLSLAQDDPGPSLNL